jgi:hypothetical protein
MAPQGHAVISAGIGVVIWAFTRSVGAAVTAVAVGVLMDVDHLLDYYFWLWREQRTRILLVLHGFELAVPMFLATWLSGWNPVLLAASIAHLAHMVTDQFTNHPLGLMYLLTYRAAKRFRVRELLRSQKEGDLYRELLSYPGVLPVLRRLHPKFGKYRADG